MTKTEIGFVLFVVVAATIASCSEIRIDVNGYYHKSNLPEQKLCEVKVNEHLTEIKPCQK